MTLRPTPRETLPSSTEGMILLGRRWCPQRRRGVPVRVIGEQVVDLQFPTIAHLLQAPDPTEAAEDHASTACGIPLDDLLQAIGDQTRAHLLSPVDLQPIKAAGVTFIESMLERVIEEATQGDSNLAHEARHRILQSMGSDVASIRPGSPEAMRLRTTMIEENRWSPYLEVGLGPDAEIFTKASPLSTVGTGMPVGIRRDSDWNNPEPEVVLVCAPDGRVVGATLGNDVNLRDWEGRSALLLGRAKDNRSSASIGPFIRLFDSHRGGGFDLDSIRTEDVTLEIEGQNDGFSLRASSSIAKISRDPADLAAQLFDSHDWPDGVVLYLGTMFAPTADRPRTDGSIVAGDGFTHRIGDRVRISSPLLGGLSNEVRLCDSCPKWTERISDLVDLT
ncbi:MAG: hypothetical protein P8J59_06420 [Phycisphaerales bacterium]|jgi:fumarylacetoacetate (FAA) hydrolase family protein|nr:hypothetical protein [Phycisphaerales bacterium]